MLNLMKMNLINYEVSNEWCGRGDVRSRSNRASSLLIFKRFMSHSSLSKLFPTALRDDLNKVILCSMVRRSVTLRDVRENVNLREHDSLPDLLLIKSLTFWISRLMFP
jgi:hypothetical protein